MIERTGLLVFEKTVGKWISTRLLLTTCPDRVRTGEKQNKEYKNALETKELFSLVQAHTNPSQNVFAVRGVNIFK